MRYNFSNFSLQLTRYIYNSKLLYTSSILWLFYKVFSFKAVYLPQGNATFISLYIFLCTLWYFITFLLKVTSLMSSAYYIGLSRDLYLNCNRIHNKWLQTPFCIFYVTRGSVLANYRFSKNFLYILKFPLRGGIKLWFRHHRTSAVAKLQEVNCKKNEI